MKILATLFLFGIYILLGCLNWYLWKNEDEIIIELIQKGKKFGDCIFILGAPRILFFMMLPLMLMLLFLLIGGKL